MEPWSVKNWSDWYPVKQKNATSILEKPIWNISNKNVPQLSLCHIVHIFYKSLMANSKCHGPAPEGASHERLRLKFRKMFEDRGNKRENWKTVSAAHVNNEHIDIFSIMVSIGSMRALNLFFYGPSEAASHALQGPCVNSSIDLPLEGERPGAKNRQPWETHCHH